MTERQFRRICRYLNRIAWALILIAFVLMCGVLTASELPIKIDTIDSVNTGVYIETVGREVCGIDPPSTCNFYVAGERCPGYHPTLQLSAEVKYITDTTYWLTDEQIELLRAVDNRDKIIRIGPWSEWHRKDRDSVFVGAKWKSLRQRSNDTAKDTDKGE